MANNLSDLVRRHTGRHENRIKKICSPLDQLGISTFAFYSINADGNFGIISNYTEQLDFFYSEALYMNCPYLVHPSLLRTGHALIPISPKKQDMDTSQERHGFNHFILSIKKYPNKIEGFFFGAPELNSTNYVDLLNQVDLLAKFGCYFKREANDLIREMLNAGYNLQHEKGENFLKRDLSSALGSKNPLAQKFLRRISQLSSREQECIDLYQQGHSAQATGAILGISQRTVEHHFESIKDKFGCYSKRDLLDFRL